MEVPRELFLPLVAVFHVMSESPFFKDELKQKLEMYESKLKSGDRLDTVMGVIWDAMYEEEEPPTRMKTFK